MPFNQIAKGPSEPEGICRYTDEHFFEQRIKKSVFTVVNVQKGIGKEVIPIEITYNQAVKRGMIEILASNYGSKKQKSEVVKGKKIHNTFPI